MARRAPHGARWVWEASDQAVRAIKLHQLKKSQIAVKAGMSPSMLSLFLNRLRSFWPSDPRVVRLGALLGLDPQACLRRVRPTEHRIQTAPDRSAA